MLKPGFFAAALALLTGVLTAGPRQNVLGADEKNAARAPHKATAEQLLLDADRALAFLARSLKESPDHSLDARNVRQEPFWAALKRTGETLDKLKAQLTSRDPKFFETLNGGTQNAAELRSFYPRSGIKNARVEESVRALSGALLLLRKNYGREALRNKQGGELSDAEKLDFLRVKEDQQALADKFKELEIQAHENKRLSAELIRMIAQLKVGIDAPLTLAAFQEARETLDLIEGEWNAYSFYVEPKFRQVWKDSKAGETLTKIGQSNAAADAELEAEDWGQIDESMVVPASVDLSGDLNADELAEYRRYLQTVNALEIEAYYAEVLGAMEEDADEQEMQDNDAELIRNSDANPAEPDDKK